MSKVIDLPVITKLDLDPDRLLRKAIGEMSEVVIVGFDKNGDEYFASSVADGGACLWHLSRAKKKLLDMPDDSYLL